MTKFITQKDQIIAQMRAELLATTEEDRYYTEENITDCNAHLEDFLVKLEKSNQVTDKQTYLAEAIQTLCEQLSTFNNPEEEEMPEFLWGFLYLGYTKELTDFIREAALAYGFKPISTIIDLYYCRVEIGSFDWFSVVLGGIEEENFVCLDYDPDTHQFYYDENPYGDPFPLPLYNVQVKADYSELSFEVLSRDKLQHFCFLAQYPSDKVWIKTIYDLHTGQVLLTKRKKHWSSITLVTENGQLKELRPVLYDENGEAIDIFQENGGFDVFPMGINEEGELQGKHMITDTKIVDEKVFFADHCTEWQLYELQNITMQKGKITLTSTEKRYTRDQNGKLLIKNITPISLSYELKNSDFVLNFIQDVINTINHKNSN